MATACEHSKLEKRHLEQNNNNLTIKYISIKDTQTVQVYFLLLLLSQHDKTPTATTAGSLEIYGGVTEGGGAETIQEEDSGLSDKQ